MSDLSENCPVCKNKLNEHRVQDFIDCIEKLMNTKNSFEIDSSSAKNQEAMTMITDLLKKTRLMLQECDKDPDLNDLLIKYLLNQKDLLEKLRNILM